MTTWSADTAKYQTSHSSVTAALYCSVGQYGAGVGRAVQGSGMQSSAGMYSAGMYSVVIGSAM